MCICNPRDPSGREEGGQSDRMISRNLRARSVWAEVGDTSKKKRETEMREENGGMKGKKETVSV